MELVPSLPAYAAMARCYNCGQNSGAFIQLDVPIEGEGVPCLCVRCVEEAAQKVGCLTVRVADTIRENAAHAQTELEEAIRQIKLLKGINLNLHQLLEECELWKQFSQEFPASPSEQPQPSSAPSAARKSVKQHS